MKQKHMQNYALLALGGVAFLNLSALQVQAEGSVPQDGIAFVQGNAGAFGGNHGVNRTIRTRGEVAVAPNQRVQGFVGVRGNANLSFTMAAEPNGAYSQILNPLNNKPSMYVGGTVAAAGGGALEIDSGVQFEPGTFPDIHNFTAPRGWSVFHYVGDVRVPIRIYDADTGGGRPWRGGAVSNGAGSVSGQMTFRVTPQGQAAFSFPPLSANLPNATSDTVWAIRITADDPEPPNLSPTEAQPLAPWSDADNPATAVFNPELRQFSSMKRTVALTRPAQHGSKLDGIQMTGSWTECELLPHAPAVGAPNGGWLTWNWQQVNQLRTGYDTPRTGALAFNRRYDGRILPNLSRHIVEFSDNAEVNEQMRAHFVTPPTHDVSTRPHNFQRYAAETVKFNLGMVARPNGLPLE